MPPATQQALPDALQQLLVQARLTNIRQNAQGDGFTPAGMRENLASMTARYVTRIPTLDQVSDAWVPGKHGEDLSVAVRLYHPHPGEALPVMVFAHGGGHMAGSVEVYDAIARKLALASNRILVSVDYRLTPENPFPAGLDDLVQVIRGVYPLLDRQQVAYRRRLAVAGDSGGGALAASAVHRLSNDPAVRIDDLLLIYPSLDYTLSAPSIDALAEGYLLEKRRIAWLFDRYLQHDEDRKAVSPLFMPLDGHKPRTCVVTAGYCPLRDEGIAYVERLRGMGCEVGHVHFADMIHAFLNLEDLVPQACERFYRETGDFLSHDDH